VVGFRCSKSCILFVIIENLAFDLIPGMHHYTLHIGRVHGLP
jgi:hypothetical protein